MDLIKYLEYVKQTCIKFSKHYIYDDFKDIRPTYLLYKLYLNDYISISIKLNPYIKESIYLFNENELKEFDYDNNLEVYIRKNKGF